MSRTPDDILDELLVLRVQDGDRAALEKLVRRWQPRLFHHALHLTGDRDAAADVVQEVWLGVARGVRRLADPQRFRGWVFRILSNKAADWVRRRGRERARQQITQTSEPPPASNDLIDERTLPDAPDRRERLARLREAVGALSFDQQMVLRLHYGEGLAVGEVAQALGVPAGTVKSRLHHARRQLQAAIEKESDTQERTMP